MQSTEETHPDYANLRVVYERFNEMLCFINEYKRRKDLVSKYLHPLLNDHSDLLADIRKINIKSLKKKSTRFSYQISKDLGLYRPQVFVANKTRLTICIRLGFRSSSN